MWRCPKCYTEYFAPSTCNCGYDGRNEPNVTARNAFDISLTVLGVVIIATVFWFLRVEIVSRLLQGPRAWGALLILIAAGGACVYRKLR